MSWESILSYLLAPKTKLFQRLKTIPQQIDLDQVLPAYLYKLKVTLIESAFDSKPLSNRSALLFKDLVEAVVHYYEAKRGTLDRRRREPGEEEPRMGSPEFNKNEYIENALEIESAGVLSPASSKGNASETHEQELALNDG